MAQQLIHRARCRPRGARHKHGGRAATRFETHATACHMPVMTSRHPRRRSRARALRTVAFACCPISGRAAMSAAHVRVVLAALFLIGAKAATVYVPIVYSRAVDALAPKGAHAMIAVPVALIVGYGLLRIASSGFGELRDAVFAAVQQRAVRRVALRDLRAPAPAVAALPPRPADRRAVARHRPRHQGHRERAAARRVQHPADAAGGACWSPAILWRMFDWRYALLTLVAVGVYISLHARLHQLARALPPHHERDRQRGADQGARQPAELRDGQVFRQRGARGRAATTMRWRATSAPRCAAR